MSCKYCKDKSTELEVLVSDNEDSCKWCPHDKCNNYDDSCYGIGITRIEVNFCPHCGEKLKKINQQHGSLVDNLKL